MPCVLIRKRKDGTLELFVGVPQEIIIKAMAEGFYYMIMDRVVLAEWCKTHHDWCTWGYLVWQAIDQHGKVVITHSQPTTKDIVPFEETPSELEAAKRFLCARPFLKWAMAFDTINQAAHHLAAGNPKMKKLIRFILTQL